MFSIFSFSFSRHSQKFKMLRKAISHENKTRQKKTNSVALNKKGKILSNQWFLMLLFFEF